MPFRNCNISGSIIALHKLSGIESGIEMAKRGRPLIDAADRKSEPVSVRMPKNLRARLDEARKEANPQRGLSQEIELRLRESFDRQFSDFDRQFGGPDNFQLMRIIGEQIAFIEQMTGRSFLNDRYTFDQVRECIGTLLEYFKPRKQFKPSKHQIGPMWTDHMRASLGKRSALLALGGMESSVILHNPNSLPGFVDLAAAGKRLVPRMAKSPARDLMNLWRRHSQVIERGRTKPKKGRKK